MKLKQDIPNIACHLKQTHSNQDTERFHSK